ncbi:hypothetical protein [Tessaracoccus sp.]
MALHGQIKVNDEVIGSWGAKRGSPNTDGSFTYQTLVTINGKTKRGTVQHQFGDGAALLASKVLATIGVQRPPDQYRP